MSSIPIIYFSSDIPINQDKKHGLTGVDQTALYASICKESFVLTNVKEIPFLMRRAFRVATSGRPARSIFACRLTFSTRKRKSPTFTPSQTTAKFPAHRPVADHSQLRAAIELLFGCRKARHCLWTRRVDLKSIKTVIGVGGAFTDTHRNNDARQGDHCRRPSTRPSGNWCTRWNGVLKRICS